MPLLHKQKFIRKPIPANLDPNQHVFFSKLTQEIFLDYDEYFERTILCNSLVWTCSLTGKTGLTFAEAVESEDKARKVLKSFPYALERAILFLVTLTKRSNIKDLVDELFSFTKDRYFIGESVLVASNQGNNKNDNHKQFKIIDVIAPEHSSPSDEVKNISMSPAHKQKNGIYIDASKIKYIVELTSASPSQQTVNASQIVRNKNAFTKDKLYMIIKLNCEVNSQAIWALTDHSIGKHKLNEMTFKDVFRGEQPKFEQAYGRGQFSKSNTQGKLNESSNKGSPKKKNNNESSFSQRRPLAESNKLKSSKSTSNINKTASSKNHQNSSLSSSKRKSTTSLKEQSSNKKMKSSSSSAKLMQNKSNKTNESVDDFELDDNFKFAQKVVQILGKKERRAKFAYDPKPIYIVRRSWQPCKIIALISKLVEY
jgi:bromodomain adjacent to zinc finger domain protein 1A